MYNLRFLGQYYDEETGLHYNMFRDYNPSSGQYVESDPIWLKGGLNTYAYMRSNPLIYIAKQYRATLKLLEARGNYQNIHHVPLEVLAKMQKNMQKIMKLLPKF